MQFEHPGTTYPSTPSGSRTGGGIVEEHIGGVEGAQPERASCASRRSARSRWLSTHDQLLGGRSGQTYLGCRFPADFGYARAITAEARRSARAYSRARACSGRFAVDFVVVRDAGGAMDAVRHRAQPAQGRHDDTPS
jgi:hypothetical protein